MCGSIKVVRLVKVVRMRNSVIWIVRMDKTKTRRLLLFCLWVLRKGLPEVVFAEKVFNKV